MNLPNYQCPKCFIGHLIIRQNKKTLSEFLGCSEFPVCKYIENFDRKRLLKHLKRSVKLDVRGFENIDVEVIRIEPERSSAMVQFEIPLDLIIKNKKKTK